MMRLLRTISMTVFFVGISACGTTTQPAASPATDTSHTSVDNAANAKAAATAQAKTKLDVSHLRSSEYDYIGYRSPEEMAKKWPVVVLGVVDGYQPGPVTETYENGPLDYSVVMRIRVIDKIKLAKGHALPGDLVYLQQDMGSVQAVEGTAADTWLPLKTLEDFEKSVPAGTSVLVLPEPQRWAPHQKMRDPGRPLIDGAKLMITHPQGLIFEDPSLANVAGTGGFTLVGGKEDLLGPDWHRAKTMNELVARLKSADIQN